MIKRVLVPDDDTSIVTTKEVDANWCITTPFLPRNFPRYTMPDVFLSPDGVSPPVGPSSIYTEGKVNGVEGLVEFPWNEERNCWEICAILGGPSKHIESGTSYECVAIGNRCQWIERGVKGHAKRDAIRKAARSELMAADKTCTYCGATFHSAHPRAKYCSDTCRNAVR